MIHLELCLENLEYSFALHDFKTLFYLLMVIPCTWRFYAQELKSQLKIILVGLMILLFSYYLAH